MEFAINWIYGQIFDGILTISNFTFYRYKSAKNILYWNNTVATIRRIKFVFPQFDITSFLIIINTKIISNLRCFCQLIPLNICQIMFYWSVLKIDYVFKKILNLTSITVNLIIACYKIH